MFQYINQSAFHDAFFHAGRKDQFSYEAKNALFQYIEDYEQDTGEKYELDVIALCCEWSEEESALDAAKNYSTFCDSLDNDLTDEEKESEALEFLQDNTQVIELDNGGILYVSF